MGMSRVRISLTLLTLSCAQIAYAPCVFAGPHEPLISKHAAAHGVPESLVRRIIQIESRGNARAVSKGNYGLMQIRMGTARAMGYRGTEQGLLDADTNMAYAVKYLAGAYRAAGCNEGRAVSYYQRGYYGARRSKCATPVPSATQIAERREQKNLEHKPAERTTVAAGSGSDQAVLQAGDVLKPRVVQTQTIWKPRPDPRSEPKPELAPKLAAAKTEPASLSAAPTVAAAPAVPAPQMVAAQSSLRGETMPAATPMTSKHAPLPAAKAASEPVQPPAEPTLKDVLTQPITRPRLEPVPRLAAAKTEPAAVPDGRIKSASTQSNPRPVSEPAPQETVARHATESTPRPPATDGKVNTPPAAKANAAAAPAPANPVWQIPPSLMIATLESHVVPMPRVRPSIDRPPPQAAAALEAEAVPVPAARPDAPAEEKLAKPAHNRARGSRKASSDTELVRAVKKFFTPKRERKPRSRVTQPQQPDQPQS
jgi:hypothetical protein